MDPLYLTLGGAVAWATIGIGGLLITCTRWVRHRRSKRVAGTLVNRRSGSGTKLDRRSIPGTVLGAGPVPGAVPYVESYALRGPQSYLDRYRVAGPDRTDDSGFGRRSIRGDHPGTGDRDFLPGCEPRFVNALGVTL